MKAFLLIGLIVLGIALSGCVVDPPFPCGIESCSGSDITCGPNIPMSCPAAAKLDDDCRRFVACEYSFPKCQLIKAPAFEECKNCVEQCIQTAEIHKRQECVYDCTKMLDQEWLCDKLSNQKGKDSCYMQAGSRKEDETICEKISEGSYSRDYCYLQIAKKKNDESLCEKVVDPTQITLCYKGVSGGVPSADICEEAVDQQAKDSCYNLIAIETSDEKLCERIVTPFYQGECYGVVAAATNNPQLCENIVDAEMKERCLQPEVYYRHRIKQE